MPMNTSGAASGRHLPRLFSPMPGSISTGTTPALNSAKVEREEIEARADHDRGPGPRRRFPTPPAPGDPVAVLVELAIGQVAVADPALRGSGPREPPRRAGGAAGAAIACRCQAMLSVASRVGGNLESSEFTMDNMTRRDSWEAAGGRFIRDIDSLEHLPPLP